MRIRPHRPCSNPSCAICYPARGGGGGGSIGSAKVYRVTDRSPRGADESAYGPAGGPDDDSNEHAIKRTDPKGDEDDVVVEEARVVEAAPELPSYEIVVDADLIQQEPVLDLPALLDLADAAEMRDAVAQASCEVGPEFGDLLLGKGIAPAGEALLDLPSELGSAVARASFSLGPEAGALELPDLGGHRIIDPIEGVMPDLIDPLQDDQDRWDPSGELRGEGS